MKKSFIGALLTLGALGFVSAHFTLDHPKARGFREDDEPNFCGGFTTNASGRQSFPLSGQTPIVISSHHPTAEVAIIISFNSNPTSFAQFKHKGQPNFLMPFGKIKGETSFCFNVDISSLRSRIPKISEGTLATLQVEYNGGDGLLYQCSDLILQKNFVTPKNVACVNGTLSNGSA
ncbi:hypothetical protein O181_076406 [Austropuccinia psidii MF-1]|uniref:Copper acquisition factor BIM1-like domain-containing protein n=1 Tax=Austropuccinia psidii MF-1 TaxID=1389203 RepID=A0A9Q3FG62_9BASI|nr:hypothetical protein [Austropuccinia psidii MF-1]